MGFRYDPLQSRCPYHLGNGFGPPIYHKLYEVWGDLNAKDLAWFEGQVPDLECHIKRLTERMEKCDNAVHDEGVLSNAISLALSELVPIISKALGGREWNVLHQYFTGDKSRYRVDIAVLDRQRDTVHAIVEVKWNSSEFPESEATAYSRCFFIDESNPHNWLPVFAISKIHMALGVAFDGIADRWVYSEISRNSYPLKIDLLAYMKFVWFIVVSAGLHAEYGGEKFGRSELRDKSGNLMISNPIVIGRRVLLGLNEKKVLKLYANRREADKALANQIVMQTILGVKTLAKVHDGCCAGGICAIVDDYIKHTEVVTFEHMKNLAKQVDKLFKAGYVHGDLRLPNILFLDDGCVRLIDFDWSGSIDAAHFPVCPNIELFKTHSKSKVSSVGRIAYNFDWCCLADLLECISCPDAVDAALAMNVDGIIAALSETEKERKQCTNLFPPSAARQVQVLDLSCIGITFYRKATKKRTGSESASASST